MLNTFKRGGVHPDDGKIYAKDKAIETPAVPDQVVIPMSQHFGAPCTPTVKVGDLVKKARLLGPAMPSCMLTSTLLRPVKSSR